MTGLPAKILGLTDRGLLQRGNYADIVVFDPEVISDKADYENPYQSPVGIDYVLVNGGIVFRENSLTKDFRGRALRRSQ